MDIKFNLKEVIELKQHFINSLNPNINVDLIASNSGWVNM